MRFAELKNKRILADPLRKNANCPLCKSIVIPKCGEIKSWHWAHKNKADCDSFGEPETEWHLNWKDEFPEEYQEIIIEKDLFGRKIKHIADIKINNIVLEFQNSSISSKDITKREKFYDKMVWILNGASFAQHLRIIDKEAYFSFKWKWFPKSWSFAEKPVFIDLSYKELILSLEIEKHLQGQIHCSYYTSETNEWEDNSGHTHEREYPHYEREYYEDTPQYISRLQKELATLREKNIFIIKKMSSDGVGWGKLISKADFVRGFKNG